MKTIGQRIEAERLARKWTRRKLAAESGYTEQTLYDWIHNRYKPSEKAIRAVEKAFGKKLRA